MRSESAAPALTSRTQQIANELDGLFQKQVDLMKSETLVGLTPAQRQEYEKTAEKIHQLFAALARLK